MQQRLIPVEGQVEHALVDDLLAEDRGGLVLQFMIDGDLTGAMGFVCREGEDHPSRAPGLHHRTISMEGLGVSGLPSEVSPLEGDWVTGLTLYEDDCGGGTHELSLWVSEAVAIASCDDVNEVAEVGHRNAGTVLAGAETLLDEDAGDCVETRKQIGPSATNAFTEASEIAPFIIAIDENDRLTD